MSKVLYQVNLNEAVAVCRSAGSSLGQYIPNDRRHKNGIVYTYAPPDRPDLAFLNVLGTLGNENKPFYAMDICRPYLGRIVRRVEKIRRVPVQLELP